METKSKWRNVHICLGDIVVLVELEPDAVYQRKKELQLKYLFPGRDENVRLININTVSKM